MIRVAGSVFHINTKNTSYIFRVTEYADLEHLYYGGRIEPQNDYSALVQKRSLLLVSTMYPQGNPSYNMDGRRFEYSLDGCGDMRGCACRAASGNTLCRFRFDGYSLENMECGNLNPAPHGEDECMVVTMRDEITGAVLQLYYKVFYDCDCITRFQSLTAGQTGIHLNRFCSLQLDLPRQDMKQCTFNGAWGRERHKQETVLPLGITSVAARGGASSAGHNPFVMLADITADNRGGEVYAFNLIYSGNHCESVECCPYGTARFLSGIGGQGFSEDLAPGASFYAPEAVMTYSASGFNGVSHNMHSFVREHIVPASWAGRVKPVLVNSWEAMYFDITEEKICRLADRAAETGAELLVIDDGWFGRRNDDTSSLGDWYVNAEKFPNGLKAVADKVKEKGLLFGLWFEPEMVSVNSDLFRAHPDWALGNLQRNPLVLGRNQLVLDLTRREVQDYIIHTLSARINEIGIDYIKWDFNRLLSDSESKTTPVDKVMHTYVLGLYRVLHKLTEQHPTVLFELCASGGARFDLGMMCYMPIGWASDNTDVLSRALIQEGTSYGYPPSVMCNHISVCPNHMTKRSASLQSRYATACFGVFGMQYDLTACDEETLMQLKKDVFRYKEIRAILQNASFYRLIDGFNGNFCSWLLVDETKNTAFLYLMQKLFSPVRDLPRIRLAGLLKDATYQIAELGLSAKGEVFLKNGVLFPQNYEGNEESGEMSCYLDFTAKVYKIERIAE